MGNNRADTGKCFRCGVEIPEPDMQGAIQREAEFRENFENTWDEGRVLVCTPCFDEMDAETDDFERSQL